MRFPYRTKFGGCYYEAGVDVPIPAESTEPKEKEVSEVEPKNNADTKGCQEVEEVRYER